MVDSGRSKGGLRQNSFILFHREFLEKSGNINNQVKLTNPTLLCKSEPLLRDPRSTPGIALNSGLYDGFSFYVAEQSHMQIQKVFSEEVQTDTFLVVFFKLMRGGSKCH